MATTSLTKESTAQPLCIEKSMARMGFEIKTLDLNAVTGCVRMQIVDTRHRQVTFSSDALGRASITVEQLGMAQVTVGRRGDRGIVSRWTSEFLGRQRYQGRTAGLQGLCLYLADNAPSRERLAEGDVLALLLPLLDP